MLKHVYGVKTNTINLSTFEHYFESINSPSDPFFNRDEDILNLNDRFAKNEFQVMFSEFKTQKFQKKIF